MANCITNFINRLFCKRYPKRIFIIDTIDDQLYRDKIIRRMKESMRIAPEPPPKRLIREDLWFPKPPSPLPILMKEGHIGPYCTKCGSSLSRSGWFKTGKYCVQPRCDNHRGIR